MAEIRDLWNKKTAQCKRWFGLGIFTMFYTFGTAYAAPQIASDAYVQQSVENRVSVDADANQDMQGTYTVSGTLTVPTQPLPANEIVQ